MWVCTLRLLTSQDRDSGALLQLLLSAEEHLHCGSWIQTNGEAGSMVWSPELCRILQVPEEHAQNLDALLALVAKEDRDLVRASLNQSWLSGESVRLEHRLRLMNGQERVVVHRCFTRCDEDGNLLHSVGTLQPIARKRSLQEETHFLSHTDSLTGLPNRLATIQHLTSLIRCAGYNAQIAVCCLDLDNFHGVNDALGVEAGNSLLIWTAHHLRDQLEPGDWLARLESDSFLVIRPNRLWSIADAIDLGQHLVESIHGPQPDRERWPRLRLNACAGISTWPEHHPEAEGLIQAACTALGEAKRRGQGKVRVYSTLLSQRLRENVDLEQRLSSAIANGEFKLHYQPQFDQQGQLKGAEALLRWTSQGNASIPCDRFIPIAEQTGQIHSIGAWTLQNGIQQLKQWNSEGIALPKLSINISARQLESGSDPLDEVIETLCLQQGVNPDQIELELTETSLLSNHRDAATCMTRLQDLGVMFWVDDFGTGYSNLKALQTLPLKGLKVDKSFVQRLQDDSAAQSIVRATIELAHSLGLECIAEGVENEKQLQRLRELGCDGFQGFLLAKPMEAGALTAWLTNRGTQDQILNAEDS